MPVHRWRDGAEPTEYPGIYRTKTGFRVRVRAKSPNKATQIERNEHFPGITLREARQRQEDMRREIVEGEPSKRTRISFSDYVDTLMPRKIALGELRTIQSQREWLSVLACHITPTFGSTFVHAVSRRQIEEWKAEQAASGAKVTTINHRLQVLFSVLRTAIHELELERDLTAGVRPLEQRVPTYSEEEPNSLTVPEMRAFLAAARIHRPAFYAQIVLGFATGRRPSELRALRRSGPTPDVLWDEGVILIRRSHTLGSVLEGGKTNKRLRIPLPPVIMAILRQHVARLTDEQRATDLLFPGERKAFQYVNALQPVVKDVAALAQPTITKQVSPRCMRRTYQDIMRAAGVSDLVTRAISGHATASMQAHYSTVQASEVLAGLNEAAKLMGLDGDDRGDEAAPGGSSN